MASVAMEARDKNEYAKNLENMAYKVMDKFATKFEALLLGATKAMYESIKGAKAVIHIHNEKLWQALIGKGYPTVGIAVEYGTKEIATAGHHEGVFVFAENIEAAYRLLKTKTMTVRR